jgi:multicomponent Na+:H+ antiporter subunit D
MFIASILAVYEDSIERMLAYSSVAQIGYITLGLAIANRAGLTGSIVHLLNHAVMKATLFMAIGAVVYRLGTSCMSELAGIGRKMPITMALFILAGLSIIGVPGTAGFISKWQLGVGAVNAGMWPLVFVLVASSLIAVVYVGKVVEVAYFRKPGDNLSEARDPPATMLIPMIILAAATIYFGLDTTWSAKIADSAAQILVGGLK